MTYFELLSKANRLLEKGDITIGQRDEMTKPLWDEIRLKGEWIENKEHAYLNNGVCKEWTNFYCSACDVPSNAPSNYCPNCGAKMRGNAE